MHPERIIFMSNLATISFLFRKRSCVGSIVPSDHAQAKKILTSVIENLFLSYLKREMLKGRTSPSLLIAAIQAICELSNSSETPILHIPMFMIKAADRHPRRKSAVSASSKELERRCLCLCSTGSVSGF